MSVLQTDYLSIKKLFVKVTLTEWLIDWLTD